MSTKKEVVLATPAPLSHRTAEENLGLGYLAAVLRERGVKVRIVDAWLEGLDTDGLARRIAANGDPLWLGFASYAFNMGAAVETSRKLGTLGFDAPVVAGGFGPTFNAPDFLEAGFDYVIRGEGEPAAIMLTEQALGRADASEVPGASRIDDGQQVDNAPAVLDKDLDNYPFPARDTLDMAMRRKSAIHMSTARGCTAHCLFCSIHSFQTKGKAPRWRCRSTNSMVEEMKQLYARGVRHIKMVDDSFIEPPRDVAWSAEFADAVEENGLDFTLWTYIRADRVGPAILSNLHRAGFRAFFVGIESFSQTALDRWRKPANVQDNLACLDEMRRQDFVVQAGLILFDEETVIEEIEENLEAYREYPWLVTKGAFTELYAAEGTPTTRLLLRKGAVTKQSFVGQNYVYQVHDPTARAVYDGVKVWHRAHMAEYDKAIDPLSAPKAIDREEMRLFEPAIAKLRELDLDFLGKAVAEAKRRNSSEAVVALAEKEIERTAGDFARIARSVDSLYKECDVVYDADENPYI